MNVKKYSALLLLLLSAAMIFSGCGGEVVPDETQPTEPAVTTEEPAPETLDIAVGGKSEFRIIRSETPNEAVHADANLFKKRIDKILGTSMDYQTDWVKPGTDTSVLKEILIGETDRTEYAEFYDSLPEHGYGYAVIGQKLVIAGKTPTLTAAALVMFENKVLWNKEYTNNGNLSLPAGFSEVLESEKADSRDSIIRSSSPVVAYTGSHVQIPPYNGFNAAQGAATDGTYFYCVLKKKSGDLETDVIAKMKIGEKKPEKYSEELPLDHANDMCYNPDENLLVIPNMLGKKISFVDPETLTLVKSISADALGGTPWAIGYNAKEKLYVVFAGGYINFCDKDFYVKRQMSFHNDSNYVGQGLDCDENYIYVPMSYDTSKGTSDNIIVIYDWNNGYIRTVHLDQKIESETMINYDGKYWIVFNSGGAKISEIFYATVYN